MSLGEHLIELRKRLFIGGGAIIVFAIAGWFFSQGVVDLIRIPINEIAASRDAKIVYGTVSGSFDLRIQISFMLGIVGSSPIWLYQVFAFLVPGLTGKEKRYTFGFFFSAVPLFFAGAALGWIIFPRTVELLVGFSAEQDAIFLDAKAYYDFVIKLVLAIGIAFVLPVFLVLLNFVSVLSAKAVLGGWRVAILLIVVFTALATPASDPITMLLLAVPMVALYFAAAGVCWLHDRRVAKQADLIDAELAVAGE